MTDENSIEDEGYVCEGIEAIKPHVAVVFEEFMGKRVVFQVVALKETWWIWVGAAEAPRLGHLALGTSISSTRLSDENGGAVPCGTALWTTENGGDRIALAKRLAKRFGGFVFVSYNLPDEDLLEAWAEKRIASLMETQNNDLLKIDGA